MTEKQKQMVEEYQRTVIRTRDGRPAISYMTWCFNRGINPYEV